MTDLSLFWLVQGLIVLGLGFNFLQAFKLVSLKRSKVNKGYFFNVLVYVGVAEWLILTQAEMGGLMLVVLFFAGLVMWLNLIKFSIGKVQKDEVSWYNRVEHAMGGLLLFAGLYILGVARWLPLEFKTSWAEGLVLVLLTNFLSVVHELVELLVDKLVKKPYLIGPGVFDTNLDLLMTFIGSLVGFLGVLAVG